MQNNAEELQEGCQHHKFHMSAACGYHWRWSTVKTFSIKKGFPFLLYYHTWHPDSIFVSWRT